MKRWKIPKTQNSQEVKKNKFSTLEYTYDYQSVDTVGATGDADAPEGMFRPAMCPRKPTTKPTQRPSQGPTPAPTEGPNQGQSQGPTQESFARPSAGPNQGDTNPKPGGTDPTPAGRQLEHSICFDTTFSL